MHGALLLGLVSGLVASRLPGLVRERKKLTHVSLLKQVQALSWQESRSAKTLDLYLKMISVYIHMISRLASHDLVQLVLVLLWPSLLARSSDYKQKSNIRNSNLSDHTPRVLTKGMAVLQYKLSTYRYPWSGSQTHPSPFHCGRLLEQVFPVFETFSHFSCDAEKHWWKVKLLPFSLPSNLRLNINDNSAVAAKNRHSDQCKLDGKYSAESNIVNMI